DGLVRADYEVTLRKLATLDVHPSLMRSLALVTAAPNKRVDLGVHYATLTVSVYWSRGPLEGIKVSLDTEQDAYSRFPDGLGNVTLATPPYFQIPLAIGGRSGAEYRDRILTSGDDQEVTYPFRLR